MTPFAALIAGLTTGGLTCLAVQGGLLLGLLAKRDDADTETQRSWSSVITPVSAFLLAKIIAYTALGFGLGFLGGALQLSLGARLWLQVFAGLVMIISGLRLFFPRFLPWLELRPPAGIRRLVRQSARAQNWFAPATLGALTVLIPCGTTQAMELAAITTGNPLEAAGIMLGFTIGTAPLFVLIGVLARGTAVLQRRLTTAAAVVVIALGVYSMNGVLVAIDSPIAAQNIVAAWGSRQQNDSATTVTNRIVIEVAADGYRPARLTVPAGERVTIDLQQRGLLGCTSLFVIPKLSLQTDLSKGNRVIDTVFPEPGKYRFTCGMGMYSGIIEAV